jgi:hypothetical protein
MGRAMFTIIGAMAELEASLISERVTAGMRAAEARVLSAFAPAGIAEVAGKRDFSGGLQHTQNRCGAAKEVEPAVVGGDLLIGSGAGTEKITQLVVGATEFAGRSWALEPAHRTIAAFDAAMILLQSVIEIPAVAMPHICAQDRPDRAGTAVVPIRGDPVGRDPGDHLGRLKERLRRSHVAMLAEHHVDQRARAIDGTVEITPLPVDLDIGLVDVPAPACLATSASPQIFRQHWRELGFPVANRFVTEHDAADQEHLGQITQGKLIAQAPKRHEGDDVTGVLRPVQNAGTPLIELLGAGAATEPAVTLSSALTPFRNSRRAASNAFYLSGLLAAALYHAGQSNRDRGANADRTERSAEPCPQW